MNHSNYTGVAESLTQSFKDLAESIRKGFGIFSEQENRRIHFYAVGVFLLKMRRLLLNWKTGIPFRTKS
ncbi:hypothetical protein UM9_03043 [Enterococcus faecalis EnGen0298]|uniref:hypothetical protein n=1 Tax=Enterococcus faecalis TaxID=1351 RepID=UPI0003311A78|nr:hypothetical protein [Enterococcus faecalis]EOI89864.1 hypothetical protein UM9_03043 [Enterococcus faecalis EnGen0298]